MNCIINNLLLLLCPKSLIIDINMFTINVLYCTYLLSIRSGLKIPELHVGHNSGFFAVLNVWHDTIPQAMVLDLQVS